MTGASAGTDSAHTLFEGFAPVTVASTIAERNNAKAFLKNLLIEIPLSLFKKNDHLFNMEILTHYYVFVKQYRTMLIFSF